MIGYQRFLIRWKASFARQHIFAQPRLMIMMMWYAIADVCWIIFYSFAFSWLKAHLDYGSAQKKTHTERERRELAYARAIWTNTVLWLFELCWLNLFGEKPQAVRLVRQFMGMTYTRTENDWDSLEMRKMIVVYRIDVVFNCQWMNYVAHGVVANNQLHVLSLISLCHYDMDVSLARESNWPIAQKRLWPPASVTVAQHQIGRPSKIAQRTHSYTTDNTHVVSSKRHIKTDAVIEQKLWPIITM